MEKRQNSSFFVSSLILPVCVCLLIEVVFKAQLHAKEFTFKPSVVVNTELARQEFNAGSGSTRQGEILQIIPSLSVGYKTNRIELSSILSAENIFRSNSLVNERSEQNSDYFTLDGNLKINLLKDIATLSTRTKYYQQVISGQAGQLSDKLLDSGSFVNVFNYDNQLSVQNPVPSQIRATANIFMSGRQTEESNSNEGNVFGGSQINSDTTGVELIFADGYRDQLIDWRLNYSTRDTDRGTFGQLVTENVSAEVTAPLHNNLGVTLSAAKSNYSVEGNVSLTDALNFSQFGVGLHWDISSGTEFSLIKYQSERGDDSTENYVGGSIRWRVSSLTNVLYERSANARGQTDNFQLVQNNRYIKTRVSVSQGISINSRQVSTQNDLGTFVCPLNNMNIENCYQPDSLSYQPTIGERVVSFNEQDFELSEEIVEHSKGVISIGYDNQNKIKTSVIYNYSKQQSLENGLLNVIRQSFTTNFSYVYSTKTKVGVVYETVETDYFEQSLRDLDSTLSFNLNKQLTQKLTFQSNLKFRHRQSQRNDWDVNEYRLSASIQYTGL